MNSQHSWIAHLKTSRTLLAVAICASLAFALSLLLLAGNYFSEPSELLGDQYRQDGIFTGIVISVFLAAAVVGLFLCRHAHNQLALALTGQGFSFSNNRGTHRWLWEDVNEIYEFVSFHNHRPDRPRNYHYTLYHRDGRRLKIGGLENMAEVGQRLLEASTQQQLEPAVNAYLHGGTVRFGKRLRINSAGIYDGEDSLEWDDVERIEIDPKFHHVTVIDGRKHQQWRRFQSAATANVRLLHLFVDRLGLLNSKLEPDESRDPQQVFPERIYG